MTQTVRSVASRHSKVTHLSVIPGLSHWLLDWARNAPTYTHCVVKATASLWTVV